VRDISGTLEAAQIAQTRTPYIAATFYNKDSSVSYDYSDRILQIEHNESPYDDNATIVLKNADLQVQDLLGFWVQLGYGFVASGNESSPTSRLWVKGQLFLSRKGELVSVLTLEGMWNMMSEVLIHLGGPPYYNSEVYDTYTIYEILEDLIENRLAGDTTYVFTLSPLGTQDDGIINTFVPYFEMNEQPFETILDLIKALMAMTKCFLRAESGLNFKVVYPQDTDDVNRTYWATNTSFPGVSYYFTEYTEMKNLVIPNRIVVFANQNDDGSWTNLITAEAKDLGDMKAYVTITEYHVAATIDNQNDADDRAAAILYKVKMDKVSARGLIPHDCRVETYDKLGFAQSRGTS